MVTIGGNVEIADKVTSGSEVASYGELNYAISEGTLYSRENPKAPIAYILKYLKDNRIAELDYNTEDSLETCQTYAYDHESLDVDNSSIFNLRFRLIYKSRNGNNTTIGGCTTVNNGQRKVVNPTDRSQNVKVVFQLQDAFI